MGLISQTFKERKYLEIMIRTRSFFKDLTIYGHCGNIGHVIKAICLLLSTTLLTPKKAPQKMAQIDQKFKRRT